MGSKVLIAGVGMVPFARPGRSAPYDVMAEISIRAALDDAQLDYDLVDQVYAGFVLGESCSGQRAAYRVGRSGVPITNVNNNCASGSTALHSARLSILSGEAECALAIGFEEIPPGALPRIFPNVADPLERHLYCADDAIHCSEADRARPHALRLFSAQCEWMRRALGISEQTLARVAVKARSHAASNPYAIFRDPLTVDEILAQPPLFGGLRRFYACPPSCGAAAAIICTPTFAARHGVRRPVAISAQTMVSDVEEDIDHPNVLDVLGRGNTRRAALRAYEQAGVSPEDIDVAEVHDCSVSNEMISCASLGFCDEGDLERFVLEGENTYGGKIVICPSGGLLSKGHPLGATGLAQIAELTWQLRGEAQGRQVSKARTALQHNGGLGSATVVTILQTV